MPHLHYATSLVNRGTLLTKSFEFWLAYQSNYFGVGGFLTCFGRFSVCFSENHVSSNGENHTAGTWRNSLKLIRHTTRCSEKRKHTLADQQVHAWVYLLGSICGCHDVRVTSSRNQSCSEQPQIRSPRSKAGNPSVRRHVDGQSWKRVVKRICWSNLEQITHILYSPEGNL